jgi:2-polyprenyl-3-methyl-5-hydroxy-6-metoxy-1,4-benzoquinol methylase
MNQFVTSMAKYVPDPIRKILRPLYEAFVPPHTESIMYRVELFRELTGSAGQNAFKGKRILEIGPKDGLDSSRLASLSPSELVMIDLPEKRAGNEVWLKKLACPNRYIEANFMYMAASEISDLGAFALVWCTGVLYHNAEQLRMLRKLYKLLDVGGCLVLESALMRAPRYLLDMPLVEIHYPVTHRNTGTVTHLPTVGAIKAWLKMVGFAEIHDADCYRKYNSDVIGQRYACICRKASDDSGDSYYQKSGLNPKYRFGDST